MFVSRNLRKTESRKNKLEDLLNSVGARVNELKEKYVRVFPLLALRAAYSPTPVVLFSLQVFVLLLCFVLSMVHVLLFVTHSAMARFASAALRKETALRSLCMTLYLPAFVFRYFVFQQTELKMD